MGGVVTFQRGYSAKDVASLLGVSAPRLRSLLRAGFLSPERGPGGELRFSFQDLVLLRTAMGLLSSRVKARKVKEALQKLREQLPSGRPLSGVTIAAQGDGIVVRDGDTLWNPESGQILFDFEVADLARKVAPLARRAADAALRDESRMNAENWYTLGCDLETCEPARALDAYRRALALDPTYADAWNNAGRLLHENGDLAGAEAQYRQALSLRPRNATAAFNLGIALEDQERSAEAIVAYQKAIDADPTCAEAYYNMARLLERMGRPVAALRHLKAYRRLTNPTR